MKKIGLNIAYYLTILVFIVALFSVITLDDRRGVFMVIRNSDIQGFMLLVGVVIGLSKSWSSYLHGALISGIFAAAIHFFITGAPLPDPIDDLSSIREFFLIFLSLIFYACAALTAIFCVKGYFDIHFK